MRHNWFKIIPLVIGHTAAGSTTVLPYVEKNRCCGFFVALPGIRPQITLFSEVRLDEHTKIKS